MPHGVNGVKITGGVKPHVKVTQPSEFLLFVLRCERGGCLSSRQLQTRKAEKARKQGTFGTTSLSKLHYFLVLFSDIFTFESGQTSVQVFHQTVCGRIDEKIMGK